MKTMKTRIQAAKRTMVGRVLCRLVGDQSGAVMMEYVILGVLVAAACVGLVWAFGGSLAGGLKVMSSAIFEPDKAGSKYTAEKDKTGTKNTEAATESDKITKRK